MHKITIQYNAQPDRVDDNGVSWPDFQPLSGMPIYAKKTGLKGRLFYQAAAAQAEDDIMFTIHYRTGLKAMMRIIEGMEIYEIKVPPVDSDGHRMWLDIHTRQVLQNGG